MEKTAWKTIKSPMGRELRLRESTPPGMDGRVWEIEESKEGFRFKATLSDRDLKGTPVGLVPLGRDATEAEILRAVGHAVDNTILALKNPQPGVTYDINVNCQEVYDAMSG